MELHLAQAILHDLQSRHLLGHEEHTLAFVEGIGDHVGDSLALARSRRTIEDEAAVHARHEDGLELRRVGGQWYGGIVGRILLVADAHVDKVALRLVEFETLGDERLDDEKDQMSDKEIEKWETKIKDSLLRRDSTLGSVMTAMQTAMMSSVEIGGKKYSLSSFGISTLGFLNAAENEQNAYHIDGDEDDANTSGKTDKLMAAINDDPDTVMQFMQQLSTNLYSAIGDKMKSTDLSSAFTIYNDKQMKTEYTNYTKTIKEWEKKISDREDYYYNKFTQMESAMTKLNSTQSSISSYFS